MSTYWMTRRCFRSCGRMVILLGVLFCGCNSGETVHPIDGRIVFADGSPVMFGDIELQSESQPINARGKIQRNGTFTVRTNGKNGAIAGNHQVVVVQVVTNHFNLDVVHDHGDLVHEKYAGYGTTDLQVTVKPGRNEFVLKVEKRENAE